MNRYLNKKASMSYLQIAVLVLSMFAISYLIVEIESIDAAEPGQVCCEETKDGNICQNTAPSNCNSNSRVSPSDCRVTEFCQEGCCVSSENGLCSVRTPFRSCELIEGDFESSSLCEISGCEKGCCILGNEAKWTTENNCAFEANSIGAPIEWLVDGEHDSEIECIFSVERSSDGACVYESGTETKCVYTTLEDCNVRHEIDAEGNPFFYRDYFCSDSELNTVCSAKSEKGCVAGEEDVYWIDSCGNKEDVATECDFYSGTYCKEEGDRSFCETVDCPDINKRHGESWCEYDGIISSGDDPAGSRHVKHICYLGTERIEPCFDFRNEICVEESANVNGGKFSQASCRVNQWRSCLNMNDAKGVSGNCRDNPDCYVKSIDMGGSFSFDVCLPNYPPGFELTPNLLNADGTVNDEAYYNVNSADTTCSMASMTCTSTWIICPLTGPICIDNCDCHTNKFTQEMNDFCVSLGDCGGYINYKGDYTGEGYRSVSTGQGSPGRITGGVDNTYGGVPAEPGDFALTTTPNPEYLSAVDGGYDTINSVFDKELLEIAGAYGSPLLLKMLSEGDVSEEDIIEELIASGVSNVDIAKYTGGITRIQINPSNAGAEWLQDNPQDEDNSNAGSIGSIVGMIAGLIAFAITGAILAAVLGALIGAIVGALAAAAAASAGMCIPITYDITFTCGPWEPPTGGANCNDCNKGDVPCSEYRCESLGQLCQFINKGTSNELCIGIPENKSYPVINPLRSVISEGYEYVNIDSNGFEIINSNNKGCIDAYDTIKFGIKTEPFSRCRMGLDSMQEYEEMPSLFGIKGNYLLPIHRMDLFFPSPDAFKNIYNLSDEQVEELGRLEYFIKCKTASGRVNPETYSIKSCVNPGPDLTAPVINPVSFPLNEVYLKNGIEEQELKIYVNEPSECRWDIEDKFYGEMVNEFDCETDLTKYNIYGLPCVANLTGLQDNSKFYFKCQDQPWYKGTEEEDNRNTMVESYEFELFVSEEPLIIKDFRPSRDDRIVEGFEPVGITLKIETSGGAEDGDANCYFKYPGMSQDVLFLETNSSIHEQEISLMSGRYIFNYMCEDIAGNIVNTSTNFRVEADRYGPTIVRVYYDSGLKVVTNSNAECRYSFARNFIWENATKMYSDGFEHFGDWRLDNYYLQCEDDYGNKGSKLKVRAYELI